MGTRFHRTTLPASLFLALCLSSATTSPAVAAGAADEADGSLFVTKFRMGMLMAQRQSWQDAIEAFQAAYNSRSQPHPELLLYIAKAHLKLSQGDLALKFYSQFVAACSSPTEAQWHEVKVGMARAQELIDSRPSPVTNRQAIHREGTRGSSSQTSDQESESTTPPNSEPQSDSDNPTTTIKPAVGSDNRKVLASIAGHNPNMPYAVTIGRGDQNCTAPCELTVSPGQALVTVSGPGGRSFQRTVSLPRTPFKMSVQHFVLSRAIAGPILIALGGLFLGGGLAIHLAGSSSSASDDNAVAFAGAMPLYLHAGAFLVTGVAQLFTIGRNSIDIQPLAGPLASRPSPLRFANLSVVPSENGKGAVASVGFRF